MFVLKNLIGTLLAPLSIAAALIISGCVARLCGRRRAGDILVITSAVIAGCAALAPVSNALLWPLESRYGGAVNLPGLPAAPRYVVVLGSGYNPRHGIPITAALDSTAVVRLAEALRLFRQIPGATLVVSGGAGDGAAPSARGYAEAARVLGVPASSLVVIENPPDTAAEIRALRQRFGMTPVLLVTSASHMPRAMALCALQGVRAVPAPTGQLAEPLSLLRMQTWLPSALQVRKTEIAVHEYLGLLALSLGVS